MKNFSLYSSFIPPLLMSFLTTLALVPLVRGLAVRFGIIDRPEKAINRKIHQVPVPLLGGLAVFLAFTVVLGGYTWFSDRILGGYLLEKYVIGVIVAGLFLMIGGVWDDARDLPAKKQIIWPILACLTVIASGIGIRYITNPLGETMSLEAWSWVVFRWNDVPYKITFLADIFTMLWLLGMMYTTKLLDGLDGLVSGIGAIGALVIFALSIGQKVTQPETALIAIIFAGCCLGFLVYNFHPARMYLGEGGSLFIGFILGLLSIISGGKIATALLIMGIPILDVGWTIVRRLQQGYSPFQHADKKHLHHRLLAAGFSHRSTVLLLYFLTATFGLLAVILQGREKFLALLTLFIVMIALTSFLMVKSQRRSSTGLDREKRD